LANAGGAVQRAAGELPPSAARLLQGWFSIAPKTKTPPVHNLFICVLVVQKPQIFIA